MAVAVDVNFIRWSFNSHVTAFECNLLGSIVSCRIEIDRSRSSRSGMWRVSHCLHIWSHWTTNKTTLVRLLPIASLPLRLIHTWCTSSIFIPPLPLLPCAYLILMNYWRNLVTIVDSHIGSFCTFLFVELVQSPLFLASICPFSFYTFSSYFLFLFLFLSLSSFSFIPEAMPLSQLFSAKLSRSLRVAICFDRGSHP